MNGTTPTVENMSELIRQVRGDAPLPGPVTAGSRFMADLGLDSLQVVGLVFLWEKQYGVAMSEQEELLAGLQTVGQAVEAIRSLQSASGHG
jgi:acyl carrier protein